MWLYPALCGVLWGVKVLWLHGMSWWLVWFPVWSILAVAWLAVLVVIFVNIISKRYAE